MKYKVRLEVFDRKLVDYAMAMAILSEDVKNEKLKKACGDLTVLFLAAIGEQVDTKRLKTIGDTIKRRSCK